MRVSYNPVQRAHIINISRMVPKMTSRRFVIPDIHGCARTFRALVEDVIRLKPMDSLYLLGDYIDRGPRSKDLLDKILELSAEGHNIHLWLCERMSRIQEERQGLWQKILSFVTGKRADEPPK